jgi:hypothetical protein
LEGLMKEEFGFIFLFIFELTSILLYIIYIIIFILISLIHQFVSEGLGFLIIIMVSFQHN